MITVEDGGSLRFEIRVPGAERVELVGDFEGWHESRLPMEAGPEGTFRLDLDVRPGTYLFRYLVDGERWVLDDDAHGLHLGEDGCLRSRAWRPPLRMIAEAA